VALVMADLAAFLAENGALPWAWGSVDCCMVLADWALTNGHNDLLAQYRGAYDDEAGCLAIVVERGGVLPIVGDGCARVGLTATNFRSAGVLAVIGSLTSPTRQWGAIWDGSRWLVRGVAGFGPMTAPTLGMWSV
jgi:hypothetical protein